MLCGHIGVRLDVGSTDEMTERGQPARLQSGKDVHVNRTALVLLLRGGSQNLK
jgi:hypothetical protein